MQNKQEPELIQRSAGLPFELPKASGLKIARSHARPKASEPAVWPGWLRLVWTEIGFVPLTHLTAIAALAGCIVLGLYFRQVEFVPTELTPLLGLAAAVTISLAAALLLFVLAIHAPVWMPTLFGAAALSAWQMAGAQACAYFVFILLFGGPASGLNGTWLLLCWALMALVAMPLCVSVLRDAKRPLAGVFSLLVIGYGASCALFGTMVVLLIVAEGSKAEWPVVAVGAAIISGLFIAINSFGVTDEWKRRGAAIFTAVVAPLILFVVLPAGYVPTWVATTYGLKLAGVSELRVPQATCMTIVSAVSLAEPEPIGKDFCKPWGNTVTGKVDVRLGSRWLLHVVSINGRAAALSSPRLTVPDLGTELVLRERSRRGEKSSPAVRPEQ